MNSITREEGIKQICLAVADCLALDPADIHVGSRLTVDLGADSLDFIDLIFTLEKKFGVKIKETELNFLAKLDLTAPGVLNGDFLSTESINQLLPWLPALRGVPDLACVTPQQLFSYMTVETLWLMVDRKLNPPAAV